jgi:hypothetical protein
LNLITKINIEVKNCSLRPIIILTFFSIFFSSYVFSQRKVDNPLLLQTWSFKKTGFLSSSFEKSKHLERKNLSFRLKKDGKVIANWIESGCFVGETKFKFKRIEGNWEKISDSVITIKFPTNNVSLYGNHVISNLTENQLTLKMFINLNKK